MACYRCSGDDGVYWVCDPMDDEPGSEICDNGGSVVAERPGWDYKWTQTVPAGTLKVWCRRGCDAKLAKSRPEGPPDWLDAGKIDLDAGDYELSCRISKHGECEVKVERA